MPWPWESTTQCFSLMNFFHFVFVQILHVNARVCGFRISQSNPVLPVMAHLTSQLAAWIC